MHRPYYYLFFFCVLSLASQGVSAHPLIEENHAQIDGLYLAGYHTTSSQSADESSFESFTTARPGAHFYFNVDDMIYTAFMALDVYQSRSEGGIAIGKLIDKKFELGGFLTLNTNNISTGTGRLESGSETKSLGIGPRAVFYPYRNGPSLLSITAEIGYQYAYSSTTVAGIKIVSSESHGLFLGAQTQYFYPLKERLYFSPALYVWGDFAQNQTYSSATTTTLGYEFTPLSLSMVF